LEYFQQESFFHLHTCVHSICTIFISYTFSPLPPHLSLEPTPQGRTCCILLFSDFVQEKKWHFFCLFKIAIEGVSLWHFHVYMYIISCTYVYMNPELVHLLYFFLLSTLVSFLWWFHKV
jgi:hypothetical protein